MRRERDVFGPSLPFYIVDCLNAVHYVVHKCLLQCLFYFHHHLNIKGRNGEVLEGNIMKISLDISFQSDDLHGAGPLA